MCTDAVKHVFAYATTANSTPDGINKSQTIHTSFYALCGYMVIY